MSVLATALADQVILKQLLPDLSRFALTYARSDRDLPDRPRQGVGFGGEQEEQLHLCRSDRLFLIVLSRLSPAQDRAREFLAER